MLVLIHSTDRLRDTLLRHFLSQYSFGCSRKSIRIGIDYSPYKLQIHFLDFADSDKWQLDLTKIACFILSFLGVKSKKIKNEYFLFAIFWFVLV